MKCNLRSLIFVLVSFQLISCMKLRLSDGATQSTSNLPTTTTSTDTTSASGVTYELLGSCKNLSKNTCNEIRFQKESLSKDYFKQSHKEDCKSEEQEVWSDGVCDLPGAVGKCTYVIKLASGHLGSISGYFTDAENIDTIKSGCELSGALGNGYYESTKWEDL